MEAGTEVEIHKSMGGGKAVIVGTMKYSDYTVLVAGPNTIGMPIHYSWLTPTGAVEKENADYYRKRYEASFPNNLKE